jgi:outer membrane biosynthesis protein TonB
MSIVIALIIVVLVSILIAKFYPKPKSTQVEEQPTWEFSPKPIPESTHVNTPAPETLTPKKEVVAEPIAKAPKMDAKPKKKKPQQKKPAKKINA